MIEFLFGLFLGFIFSKQISIIIKQIINSFRDLNEP